MKPTLQKITAADGQTLAVTTRIDVDGLLRIDVFQEAAKRDQPICSGCIKPTESSNEIVWRLANTPAIETDRAIALGSKTRDAYSQSRYGNWTAVAQYLLDAGFSEIEAEAVLRSKWTRWAADASNTPDRASYSDLRRFLLQRGSMFQSDSDVLRQVKQLVRETF